MTSARCTDGKETTNVLEPQNQNESSADKRASPLNKLAIALG